MILYISLICLTHSYACLPYLLTPLLKPTTRAQMRYNAAQKRTRGIIERMFGRMKRRFPCLNYLRLKLDNVFAVIVACSVLWNISIQRHEPEIHGPACDEVPGDIRPHPRCVRDAGVRGNLRRQRLIQDHFSR